MIMEIEHPNIRRTLPQKILYPCHFNSIHNYREVMQLYLKDRTFNHANHSFRQLDPDQIQKLKVICDKVYQKYQERQLLIGEVQGIWPLLTFLMQNINGLQIYLAFQYLITPLEIKQLNTQVKQQQREFDPQGYFQNSKWIHKKKFVKSLGKLQRQLNKRNEQQNIKCCLNLLQIASNDNYQYISAGKDFRDSYEQFKAKITREYKSRKIIEQSPFFNDRLFHQDMILSQPDMMHNVIKTFTKEEYKRHHQTITLKPFCKPIEEEEQDVQNSESNNGSEYQSTITIKQRKTSLGTKRRYGKEKSNNDTPVRRHAKAKPLKRNKLIECFFELDQKKNKILEEMKKTKRRQEKQKRKNKRLQKIQKEINYFSDDQQENKQRRQKKERKPIKKIEAQSQPQNRLSLNKLGLQDSFIDDSEEMIVMKRRRLQKKPIYAFDQQESSEQEQDNTFYRKSNKNKMVIQEEQEIAHSKKDQYSIGKIQIMQQQNENRIMEKIENLEITKLELNENGFRMMMEQFNFAKYRQMLNHLQKKQIERQVQKIIKQTIAREQVPFDIDLTLKIMAAWTVLKCSKQIYKDEMTMHISPLLKYVISVNLYRSTCEIINNSFDWANSQHLNQLKRAFMYFSTIFQVARNFISLGLQNQLMDIFYNSMITPNRYDLLMKNQTFFSQCGWINLKNPFKIGYKRLKFKLEQDQQKIAFIASSLILQILFLWRFVDRHFEAFKIRQKQFSKNLKNELTQLTGKYGSQWFYSLTKSIKKLYLSYKPYPTKQYFLLITNILNCSLQKLILQSITNQEDQQSNNQVSFLVELITDYVQARWSQPLKPNPLTILNEVILQTNFKQIYGNQRNNATSTMIYSSILRSLISNPIFQTEQAVQSLFLKYLKEYILPDLSNIIASLKNNIYEPVFLLLKQIYEFKVNRKFIQCKGNDDHVSHEEITKIIINLWDSLSQKYDDFNRLLKERLRPRNFQNFLQKSECEKQICKIKQKILKCLTGLSLFLKFFIVHDEQLTTNPLFLSASHYFFRLKFSIDYNYFIKYLGSENNDLNQCILQNVNFLLKGPKNNERKYTEIIVNAFNTASKHKEAQYSILQQTKNPLIQEAIASINAANLISATQLSKQRSINPPQNTIIKFIKQNIEGMSIEGIKYHNIEQSVYCFNFFLGRLSSYFSQKQMNERVRIKACFWQLLIGRYIKEIVILIFLGGVVENNIENRNIPIKEMVNRLRRLYTINQSYNGMKIQKDIGYAVFLYNLQRMQEYNSIFDVLSKILNYRKLTGLNKSLEKGIEILLVDVFNSFKKIQRYQREKSPITIECIRILTFLLEWPDLPVESIKLFLKEMQVISNGLSLITQIRINQTNMYILLNFFQKIQLSKTKIFKINQAMQIYISKATQLPVIQSARQNHFKKIKRILTTVRDCLKKDIRLKRICLLFIRQFLKYFCSPQKLQQNKETGVCTLQVYLEMMKNSLLQRSAYQQLTVQNRKRFEVLIPRLMNRLQKQDSHLYQTFQSAILTCMIGRYSDLYDLKRLIGAMKKDSLLTSTKKKNLTALLQKLKKVAIESEGNDEMVNWCKNQILQIEHADNFEDWMDIE